MFSEVVFKDYKCVSAPNIAKSLHYSDKKKSYESGIRLYLDLFLVSDFCDSVQSFFVKMFHLVTFARFLKVDCN